jgi:hypothetical protein
MRTLVTFSTPAFNVTETKPYFLNPASFGDDLARTVSALIRDDDGEADQEPRQEDFGWYFEFSAGGERHCFVVGYRPADEPGDAGMWIGSVERSRGLLASMLGRRATGIEARALMAILAAIERLPDVTNILWHRQPDFDKGDEDRGTGTPG